MPELPDLEAVRRILNAEIGGAKIDRVHVMPPLSIRHPATAGALPNLAGDTLWRIDRQGKYLLFMFESDRVLAIHSMLVGRFQYCDRKERLKPGTCFAFDLKGEMQLRYFDSKMMGKLYLLEEGKLARIPRWNEMGPDALDEALTLDVFRSRVKRHAGQTKSVLTNDKFVAGIGNAYADEILWEAGVYPFWARTSLSDEEIESLYHAMKSVLSEAVETLTGRMKADISEEIRDFLKVHRKGGQPCPRCGSPISQVEANRKITNYCRTCQKG
ncbi:MAG: Fpg/Nei family DNA glycosylase [Chloroflexi bacterium]|nr:Fpg/Nei family DNA glycosylase [Chloroflexota bacterium]